MIDGNEGLSARRIGRIASLVTCVDTKVNHLARGTGDIGPTSTFQTICPVSLFVQPAHLESCNIWYLGSVIRSLAKAGYYPMPYAALTKCSVQEVRTKLRSVCDGILSNGPNKSCCPNTELRSSLAKISTGIVLTDAQRKHLQQQAFQTGLPVLEITPEPVTAKSFLAPLGQASSSLFSPSIIT